MAQHLGPLPEKYKQEYRRTGDTERDTVNALIKKEQHKTLHEQKQPYCMRCARDDFANEQIKQYNKRGAKACPENLPPAEKIVENVTVKDFNMEDYKPPTHKFYKYGEFGHFIDQNINNIKTKVETAVYYAYQCSDRGFKIDVLMPLNKKEEEKPTLPSTSGDKK